MSSRGLAFCALTLGLVGACNVPLETYPGLDAARPGIPGAPVDGPSTSSPDATIAGDAAPVFGQQAYLKAANPGVAYYFGIAVALSADGSTLAVASRDDASASTGTLGDPSNTDAPGAGAVYVFTCAGATWQAQAYLKASNTGTLDHFGTSLALSGDGSTLAVGAEQESSPSATEPTSDAAMNAGAVYVFRRNFGRWQQQAFVKAANAGAGDYFGHSVALSSDGATLAVGAFGEMSNAGGVNGNPADNSLSAAGAAYVFSFVGSSWTQHAYVKAKIPKMSDAFGSSIALSADGATLAVGARFEASGATGIDGDETGTGITNAGAVYVFTATGGTWSQQAYVKASNTQGSTVFGSALALSGDGATLAVGSPGEDSGSAGIGGAQGGLGATSSGAVYVFVRAGASWMQQEYIKASNATRDSRFGGSVALSSDGSTLAVAASEEDSDATGINGDQNNTLASNSGAAYLFVRTGTWRQSAYVKTLNTDAGDDLTSVALSGDGATLAAGADGESSNGFGGPSNNTVLDSGAAYVFH